MYDVYYNTNWQALDIHKDDDSDPLNQYMWSITLAPLARAERQVTQRPGDGLLAGRIGVERLADEGPQRDQRREGPLPPDVAQLTAGRRHVLGRSTEVLKMKSGSSANRPLALRTVPELRGVRIGVSTLRPCDQNPKERLQHTVFRNKGLYSIRP